MNAYYMKIWNKDNNLNSDEIKNLDGHTLCYESLIYASKYDIGQAQKVLERISESMPNHSCPILLETKALIHFSLHEFTTAKEFAIMALKQDSAPLFAYQILARVAIFDRNYLDAIEHYQSILKYDPSNDKTLLNIAESYFLNRQFDLAIQFSSKAQGSFRKKMYIFFLSFSSWKTRLLWMSIVIASFLNLYLFYSLFLITTLILVYVAFEFGYKKGDLLIFRRALYLQMIHSILFLIILCPTIAYLFQNQ